MNSTQNFATNVRYMMAVRGVSQREMASMLDTSTPYINKVLGGDICPSLARCEDFAKALRVKLPDLLLSPRKFSELHPQRKSA